MTNISTTPNKNKALVQELVQLVDGVGSDHDSKPKKSSSRKHKSKKSSQTIPTFGPAYRKNTKLPNFKAKKSAAHSKKKSK